MARNLKKDYIRKIMSLDAPNGYRFDIENYLYNPAYGNDYPAFHKVIAETDTTVTIRRVYYMKHYNGTGEYIAETFTRQKDGNAWQVVKNRQEVVLETANRYNVKKLLTFCTDDDAAA